MYYIISQDYAITPEVQASVTVHELYVELHSSLEIQFHAIVARKNSLYCSNSKQSMLIFVIVKQGASLAKNKTTVYKLIYYIILNNI